MAKANSKSSVNRPKVKRLKKFKARLRRLLKDRLFRWFVIASFLTTLAIVILLLINVRPVDFAVPLQYSTLQGFDSLGAWYRVYIYGLFAILVTFGNLWLAVLGYDKSRITSFFLVMGSVVINIFLLVIIWTLTNNLEV